uniref:ATP synthase F0 subunit 8 n=1 Tax=Ergaula nepalensis TaxID=3037040 RepID=UPI0027A2A7DE|nr:ATP synthase F0 subunit 8 [Ergaula nepalensis]WGO57863.1 ATP synthase F0 subunit 8 [Ergaula nepalensis]
MPQMMPMNWTTLYFMFILTLMLFSFMNYYLYSPINLNKTLKSMKINNMNWKW